MVLFEAGGAAECAGWFGLGGFLPDALAGAGKSSALLTPPSSVAADLPTGLVPLFLNCSSPPLEIVQSLLLLVGETFPWGAAVGAPWDWVTMLLMS